jgi:hypothetical protein
MSNDSIIEAFADDVAARRFLQSAFEREVLPEALMPPRKWVQAIYLTDTGRLRVSTKHLARLLDISSEVATEVAQRLARIGRGTSVALFLYLMVGEFLEFVGVGFDTALVRFA